MSIRRQGYEFEFRDLGNLPQKSLDQLSERPQPNTPLSLIHI